MLKLRFNLVADAGILPEWQHHSFLPNSNPSTVEGGADEESSMTELLTPERLGGLFRGNERCLVTSSFVTILSSLHHQSTKRS